MNEQSFPSDELLALYEPSTFQGLPYRMLKPIDLPDNPDKPYPLILSLHGAGGRGNDNIKNLRVWNENLADESLRRKYPCFVVVPHTDKRWIVPGTTPELTEELISTYPVAWQARARRQLERGDDLNAGDLSKVFDLLDQLYKDYNIDQDRVYVLGHSMGGAGSWTTIHEQPERFAAAIPTAGGFSAWQDITRIVEVPIWSFHGNADNTVPVDLTRLAFQQLKELNGNMKYTELNDVGHNANLYAFAYTGDDAEKGFETHYASDRCDHTSDVWDWLFAQNRKNRT